jgi:membrane associated rhomboid family serine protease
VRSRPCSADSSESWRLFSPIFLHVGVVHLLLNMFMQVTAGALVERLIGEAS